MQKKLLGAAVAAALAVPFAASAQTMFGVVDVGYQNVSDYAAGVQNKSFVTTGGWKSSRLGVRGNEQLGGGLQAIYHIEFDIQGDTGATAAAGITQRATYVGLGNEKTWGTLTMGRQLTHSFHAAAAADGIAGVGGFTSYYGLEDIPTRSSNYFKYSSPDWGGLTVGVGWAPGEDATAGGAAKGDDDYRDLALIYRRGPLALTYGHAEAKETDAPNSFKEKDNTLTIAYSFGAAKVSAIHTTSKQSGTGAGENLRTNGIRLDYKIGKGTVTVSLASRKNKFTAASDDSRLTAIGYYHDLSKRTSLYATWGKMRNDTDATLSLFGQAPATTAGRDPRGFQLGMSHSF